MAHAGHESGPMAPTRPQPASYDADARGLLGDAARAHHVLRRVEQDAAGCAQDVAHLAPDHRRTRTACSDEVGPRGIEPRTRGLKGSL